MAPSIKALSAFLEPEQAKKARTLLLSTVNYGDYYTFCDNADDFQSKYPATFSWVRSCFHHPSTDDIILNALNEVTGGYGVEGIETEKRGWFSYVNFGDTYCPTIMYDHDNSRFFVSSWGDIAERYGAL